LDGRDRYDRPVDAWLAIASKRDTRRYADRPVPEDVLLRILDAGRVAGSARNRQPWRFVVVESADVKEQLAETVYAQDNVRGAAVAVAIVGRGGLDVGRSMQNMMLAAWNDGVASCPNGMPDAKRTAAVLGLADDEEPAVVLTFGYPTYEPHPERRSPEEWSARADRKPLDELVERL
jgi:nitroreductase